jgi:hypothetical protein
LSFSINSPLDCKLIKSFRIYTKDEKHNILPHTSSTPLYSHSSHSPLTSVVCTLTLLCPNSWCFLGPKSKIYPLKQYLKALLAFFQCLNQNHFPSCHSVLFFTLAVIQISMCISRYIHMHRYLHIFLYEYYPFLYGTKFSKFSSY